MPATVETQTSDQSQMRSFEWCSEPILDPTTNIKIYHSFKWKDQSICCYDAVCIHKADTIEVGRIVKIYEKSNEEMRPMVLVKWYCRSRDDTKKLSFEHNKEEDVTVTSIVSKATILDSESALNDYRNRHSSTNHNHGSSSVFHSFYCDEYWKLDENRNRILVAFSGSDCDFNAKYWIDQQRHHAQVFTTKSERKRSSITSHHTTATTSSHEEKQDLSQQPRSPSSAQTPRGRLSLGSSSILHQIPIHPIPPSQRMVSRPLSTNHNVNSNNNTNRRMRNRNRSTLSSNESDTASEDTRGHHMVRNANRMHHAQRRRVRVRARSNPATVGERNEVTNITRNLSVVNEEEAENERDIVVEEEVSMNTVNASEDMENDMEISNQAVDLNVVEKTPDHGTILGELDSNELGIREDSHGFTREPPRKRRRVSMSSVEYRKILKLKVKLLDSSLQQKDNIIGHYNTLIHQKDKIVDQKDGVIRQKDDVIDTYKSIVSMRHRQ